MCQDIRHRGPDDEGFYVDGGCALGMRRLSIIDLESGHQPIPNEDSSIWTVFNGEIYNFRELRKDLEARGHRLNTHGDTELLVHSYEEFGADSVRSLRGMFAYAIWDKSRRKLFLARDRFGKKPLFYAVLPKGIYFASEIQCLLTAGVPTELDDAALRLYFQFGYIPHPCTAFRAIRKLPPGCWLTYDASGNVNVSRYWSPPPFAGEDAPTETPDEARTRLRQVFDEAVRIRMISDVPLGAFLSGGIDSSCVVASMALQSREAIKTFSIGFDESTHNELPYASLIARKYNTGHHEIVVRPDCVELLTRLVNHLDEPFGDSSAIPTFILSAAVAEHVKVVLSGDGGDELFGGYERFLEARSLQALDRVPRPFRAALSWIAGRLPYSAYGKNYLHMLSRESGLARYVEANWAPYFLREQLLAPEWMLPAEAGFLRKVFADCLLPENSGLLSQAMHFELTVNLPDDMLVKVDRMSMANSLEVRCPLLDQEVAEVAASIPHSWRFRGGRAKQFLIDAFSDRLPPELLNRPKMGFGIPLASWFRGPLKPFLWDNLAGQRFLERGFVSREFLMRLLNEHESGRRDNSHWLWWLLILELWLRRIQGDTAAVAETNLVGHALGLRPGSQPGQI